MLYRHLLQLGSNPREFTNLYFSYDAHKYSVAVQFFKTSLDDTLENTDRQATIIFLSLTIHVFFEKPTLKIFLRSTALKDKHQMDFGTL